MIAWRRTYPRTLMVVLLTCILIASSGLYAVQAVRQASSLRVRLSLDRNYTSAFLAAKLLDNEIASRLEVLHLAASGAASNRSGSERPFRPDSRLLRHFERVIFFRGDGSILWRTGAAGRISETVPRPIPPGGFAAPVQGERGRFLLAAPVMQGGRQVGHIEAEARFPAITDWMKAPRIPGGELAVLDRSGRLIFASAEQSRAEQVAAGIGMAELTSLQSAGARLIDDSRRGAFLVGFARAPSAGLTVVVLQPRSAALATVNLLAGRLRLLAAPLAAIALLCAAYLIRLFHREAALSRELEERNQALQAAERMKSEFLANTSHELRTPLANMQLALSSLRDHCDSTRNTRMRADLMLAAAQADIIAAKVRNVLLMSHLEESPQGAPWEIADLTDIVCSAIEDLGGLRGERKLDLRFPPEPLMIDGDEERLVVAVLNLIENAIKYSPANSVISITGQSAEDWVILSVRNSVEPLDAKVPANLFERFARGPNARGVGGAGLGLAICRAIVEAHGGEISFQTDADAVEVRFSLPAVQIGGSEE